MAWHETQYDQCCQIKCAIKVYSTFSTSRFIRSEYLLQDLKQKDDQTNSYLLILDNASIHKGRVIDDLAARYQTRVVYLPAYSPDLNPIEKAWSVLKSKVRHMVAHSNKTLPDALDIAFKMM